MATKLIGFDLDNTLAESKSPMTLEMAEVLEELLKHLPVAVISGGAYKQFELQFLGSLPLPDNLLEKLYLFPTCGTSFYKYHNSVWTQIYAENLTQDQKRKIFQAFEKCYAEIGFVVPHYLEYGEILEDRQTQITFSALGQQAPSHLKKKWDPLFQKRLAMIDILKKELAGAGVSIHAGGSTSIDVTRDGIDKRYALSKIKQYLNIEKNEIIYIADAFFPGGNDYPMKISGIECIETSGPQETIEIIKKMIKQKELS